MYYTEHNNKFYVYYNDGFLFGIFETEDEAKEAISEEMAK